jgi:prepilin-type N-terminal cleavage/methylation domain-containing protein
MPKKHDGPVPFSVFGLHRFHFLKRAQAPVQSRKAFTLIELILVTILIGVFVGLVIPRVGILFFKYEFHDTIKNIETMIRFAQESSLLEKTTYRVTMDRATKEFALEREIYDEDEGKNIFCALEGSRGKSRLLPDDARLSSYSDSIYFFPDGTTTRDRVSVRFDDDEVVFIFDGTFHGFRVKYGT